MKHDLSTAARAPPFTVYELSAETENAGPALIEELNSKIKDNLTRQFDIFFLASVNLFFNHLL